ncbi:MAG: 30S ribosomal protein S16 [Gammaproteobacteria bacterium]|nr:30S ribosomal protein S16 [Gammaproteobacteria bacterium]MCI0590208.1 30S ribosomal protein S16 [Gammaproteobacteria bacterium]
MVVIRLARGGAKKRPFYHIVVSTIRTRRNGRPLERVGFYNPIAVGGEAELQIDRERLEHWLSKGAKASRRVADLIIKANAAQATAQPGSV